MRRTGTYTPLHGEQKQTQSTFPLPRSWRDGASVIHGISRWVRLLSLVKVKTREGKAARGVAGPASRTTSVASTWTVAVAVSTGRTRAATSTTTAAEVGVCDGREGLADVVIGEGEAHLWLKWTSRDQPSSEDSKRTGTFESEGNVPD